MKTVLGAQVVPEYLDHYLARHVVTGQQTDEPVSPSRIDNLEAPAPADMHTTHGRFDDEAQSEVTLFDPSIIRWGLIGAGLVVGAATGAGIAMALHGRSTSGRDRGAMARTGPRV